MLDITYREFHSKYQTTSSQEVEQKILQSFKDEIVSYPDESTFVTELLNKYPMLVLQAGQFS